MRRDDFRLPVNDGAMRTRIRKLALLLFTAVNDARAADD